MRISNARDCCRIVIERDHFIIIFCFVFLVKLIYPETIIFVFVYKQFLVIGGSCGIYIDWVAAG